MSKTDEDLKWCGEIRHTVDHRTTNWRMGNWVINKNGILTASSTSGHVEFRKHLRDLSKLPPRAPTGCMLNIDFSGASMSIRFKEEPKLAADLFEVIKQKVEKIGPISLARSVQKSGVGNRSTISSRSADGGRPIGLVQSVKKVEPLPVKKLQNAAEPSRYSPVVEFLSSSAETSQSRMKANPDSTITISSTMTTPPAIYDENSAFDDAVTEIFDDRRPGHGSQREYTATAHPPIVAQLTNLFSSDSPLPEDKENRPNVRRPANTNRGPLAGNAQSSLSTTSFYGSNNLSSQAELRRTMTTFDRPSDKRNMLKRKRERGPLRDLIPEYSSKRRRMLTDANQIKFGNENLSPYKRPFADWTPDKKDVAPASFQGCGTGAIIDDAHAYRFSNLGNTCYMNAILQAIFGVEAFTQQLRSALPLVKSDGGRRSANLIRALCALLVQRGTASGSERRRLLAEVKKAISADALRFSGHLQQDAHEFLAQVLDQLKDEWTKVFSEPTSRDDQQQSPPPNPVTTNFTFILRHQIKCESCGNVVTKDEEGVDMALQVSSLRLDHDRSPLDQPVNIQEMLDECLSEEDVEYKCEFCSGRSSVVTHRFARLPRCLIVYAKRYEFQAGMARGKKIAVNIDIPKYLTLFGLCSDDVIPHEPLSPSTQVATGHSSTNTKTAAWKEQGGQFLPRSPLAMSTPLSSHGGKTRRQLFSVGDSPITMPPLEEDDDDEQLKLALERSKKDTGGVRRHSHDLWDDTADMRRAQDGLMTEEEQIQMAINLSLAGAQSDSTVEQRRQESNAKDDANEEVKESLKLPTTDEPTVVEADKLVGVEADESAEVVPDSLPGSQEQQLHEEHESQMSPCSIKMSSIDDEAAVQAVNRKSSLRFEPVDSQWRQTWAERLQLPSPAENLAPASVVSKEMSYDDRPTRTASISPDGNCLFRALSYVITLKQHSHVKLRQLIVAFLNEHAETFKKLEGLNEEEWAAHLQSMSDESTWGTSLELAAIATLLQTDLWTFFLNKWYLYKPRFPLDHHIEGTSSKAIYLINENSHFEPVLHVTDVVHKARLLDARRELLKGNYESGKMENSYRLSAVVSHIGSSSGSGHYIADVFDRIKNKWIECDDSSVGSIAEEQVRQRRRSTGYIFVFTAASICEDSEGRRVE